MDEIGSLSPKGYLTQLRFLAGEPQRRCLEAHALGSEDGGARDTGEIPDGGHDCVCSYPRVCKLGLVMRTAGF